MDRWEERGFSLLEVLVAVLILAGSLTGLLQLFTVASRANGEARRSSLATVMASAKMEALRARPLPYPTAPVDALARNTAGYCELLDGAGRFLAACASPGDRAPFVRRWSTRPLAAGPADMSSLAVLVTWGDLPDVAVPPYAQPNQVRLVSLRSAGYR